MDSKIIASIIIAVGFIVGVYVYASNTPLNICREIYESELDFDKLQAFHGCADIIFKVK